jgi:hypothetical protein
MDKSEKSLPALLADLSRETVDLMRREIALARAEASEKIGNAKAAATSIGGGAVLALAAVVVLLQAAVNGLAMVLPPEMAPWLAPLAVGVVALLIGWAMLKGGSAKLDGEHLKPERTMNSLRKDGALIQQEAAR